MSRLIFEARRRLPSPVTRKGSINIEAPPELPRVIPPSLLRRALPVVIVLLIVGMIVAMVATGMRLISPQTLFFPFVLLLAATAFFRGGDNKSRTEEVDAASGAAGHGKTVEALGLSAPALGIPWSMLSLFATGPTLSRADALLAHDGLAPDSSPGRPASAEGGTR